MGKIRIGIVGYGNIGRGVEQSIKRNDDMELKAVFTRRDPASVKIQTEGAEVKHFDDMEAMKDDIDVMILCGGSATDLPVIGPKVAASFNTIDSFDTHAKIPEYFANVDKAAKEGNPHAMEFPRAKVGGSPYDFSFSGVKSAVLNHLNKCRMTGEPIVEADIAASFQQAVVDVLVDNAIRAAKDYHMDRLAIAGGVASNGALRTAMEAACEKEGIRFYRPSPIFCTDNAAMIGVAAYYEYQKGTRHGWDLNAVPNLKLGER